MKKNIKRRNLKSVEVNVENVILKPKHSEVVRCENCFISHFPKRKFCKWAMRKKGITQSNNGSFVDAQNKENYSNRHRSFFCEAADKWGTLNKLGKENKMGEIMYFLQ